MISLMFGQLKIRILMMLQISTNKKWIIFKMLHSGKKSSKICTAIKSIKMIIASEVIMSKYIHPKNQKMLAKYLRNLGKNSSLKQLKTGPNTTHFILRLRIH